MATRRAEFINKLKRAARAPPNAEDVSERWGGTITGQIIEGNRPVRGRLELIVSHILICSDDTTVLYSLALASISSLQRKKEIFFPTKSFADEPQFRSAVHFQTTSGSVLLTVEGRDGVSFSKCIELLWRYNFHQLSPRDSAMLESYTLGDALHALSLLPLDVECTVAQQISGAGVTTIDRAAVVRIEENFQFSIIFRPDDISSMAHLHAVTVNLDEVSLIWAAGDDIRVCFDDDRIFLFNNIVDSGYAIKSLLAVYLANAATMVYRVSGMQKAIVPFTFDECWKLFQQYAAVDVDLDGSISQAEFLVSLGPMLTAEKGLPKALYDLFDNFKLGKIRMFEYLYGCRVLLRGDIDDRLRYLFKLFDTRRQESITSQQFLDGLKLISNHTTLKIPRNETIETFSYRLFEEIDTNKNNDVDFEEFSRALTGNLGVMEAIAALSEKRDVWKKETQGPARVMSFGHPHWHQVTQILKGIELSVSHIVDSGKEEVDISAFNVKVRFNCTTGAVLGSEATSPKSGILRLGSKEDEVIFNDYAPEVFYALRSRYGISRDDYLSALGLEQFKSSLLFGAFTSLFEMSSSGRSGSFFYTSHDNRFVLKTIPAVESETLRRILPTYYAHMLNNPDTLITRFCGLHALIKGGNKIYFVIMANIFQARLPIRDTYDLKGSSINRSTPIEQRGVGVALKDNDFQGKQLRVAHSLRNALIKQIQADSLFLSKSNLNDYSLLLGVFTSDVPVEPSGAHLTPAPQFSAFQQFHGGIASISRTEVYFVGIIDVLTDYNFKKVGEHLGKSVLYDGKQVSCVPPIDYQDRFVRYLESVFVGV